MQGKAREQSQVSAFGHNDNNSGRGGDLFFSDTFVVIGKFAIILHSSLY